MDLERLLSQLVPSRDLGTLLGSMLHREQSLGEIRGLRRLSSIISQRKSELDEKLNPKQPEPLD